MSLNKLIDEAKVMILSEVQAIKEINKEDVISFYEKVPVESFKFICYREYGTLFLASYEILDSNYYLVIINAMDLRLYSRDKFNPLSDDKEYGRILSEKGESLESILNIVPKKAGVFLCFNMDVIKSKTSVQ